MEISTENQMVCFFLEAFDMGIVENIGTWIQNDTNAKEGLKYVQGIQQNHHLKNLNSQTPQIKSEVSCRPFTCSTCHSGCRSWQAGLTWEYHGNVMEIHLNSNNPIPQYLSKTP